MGGAVTARGNKERRTLPGPERAPYRNDELQEWAGYGFGNGESYGDDRYEWRDNTPFQATLILTGTERGRSAMRFLWADETTGKRFPMFATDMAALAMSQEGVAAGKASGQWLVMKRGANYGIARYTA